VPIILSCYGNWISQIKYSWDFISLITIKITDGWWGIPKFRWTFLILLMSCLWPTVTTILSASIIQINTADNIDCLPSRKISMKYLTIIERITLNYWSAYGKPTRWTTLPPSTFSHYKSRKRKFTNNDCIQIHIKYSFVYHNNSLIDMFLILNPKLLIISNCIRS
jgi:hypothetical protein